MNKWICHNILGQSDTNTFGMISGLALVSFLFGSWIYVFIIIPLWFFW